MIGFKIFRSLILTCLFAGCFNNAFAQHDSTAEKARLKIYRATPPRINDLVNTKLDVRFDYKKRYLYGKEWVTLKPHFYPTDTLRLDAKGMDLNNISIVKNGVNTPLKFTYDSLTVAIKLDKEYSNTENYTIYIDYIAKPNELKVKGSAAINDARGLYFINPDGTEKDKPTQIWTQGESESSSCWFPTIDKPNQKSTEEICMTVPEKYVTLSNGRLALQKPNGDGTRTDTWKMELPHAPYLFMMAVGDFKVYHDKWRDKPVDYYLEPKYAPYAKEIFGMTPEIMEFYSKTLGIDFPWNKYAQIVVRDYISGAMENTTATVHGEFVQQTHRQLLDSYYDEGRSTIAHELFHQWFGDYVTCESWSNLTVNESFADFSESLWAEHKYGKDAGDDHLYQDLQNYLAYPEEAAKSLVRFHYADKEDMFDDVTYQKGGCILNMLRNYLGDAAFFKGLNIYLKTNAFKTGEAQQLRLAFEQACGRDLNWFFNQWYYGAGNPVLDIKYNWNNSTKTETVYINQTQDGQIFKLPIAVDVYAAGTKVRHKVWLKGSSDTLTFHLDAKSSLVNVDADKMLVAQKTDNKSLDDYVFQYANAPLYLDRYEAINAATAKQTDKRAQNILIAALKDKYYGLRVMAIKALNMDYNAVNAAAVPVLISLAKTDSNTLVRAASLNVLAGSKSAEYMALYRQALTSESYAIQGAGLNGITQLEPAAGLRLAKGFEKDNEGGLSDAIFSVYTQVGNSANWPFVYQLFTHAEMNDQVAMMRRFADMASKVDNPDYALQGIEALRNSVAKYKALEKISPYIASMINDIKDERVKLKDNTSAKAADDAIKELNKGK